MVDEVRRSGPRVKNLGGNLRRTLRDARESAKDYRQEFAEDFDEIADPQLAEAVEVYLQGGGQGMLSYDPTKGTTPLPKGHRTESASYDQVNQLLFITFRGHAATYVYENVTLQEWQRFRRAQSPGRFVNRVLNNHPYLRIQ